MALSINISDKEEKVILAGSKTPSLLDKEAKPKRKKRTKLIGAIVVLCFIGLGLYLGLSKVWSFTSDIGLKITAGDFINPLVKDPELQKDSSGERTNVLLVGIDTRDTNAGLQNTDTMIVASYSHVDHSLTMFSVPRDTYALLPGSDNWYVKVNGIYNKIERNEEGAGLAALATTLEDYTGLEIQYYGMIDVHGFENIIDILGGIEVYVENSFTDYAYPNEYDEYNPYQVVSFEQGLQTMNGDTAVKYVRSRKSLDNGEGSDFARAKRQQQVIKAVQSKILSSETLLSPKKLVEIMTELQNNIKISEFTNEDIQAAIAIAQNEETIKTYSFVLDPNIGARRVIREGILPDAYSIGPVLGLGEYKELHDLIDRIFEAPAFYQSDPLIYTYDIGVGYSEAESRTIALEETLPYTTIVYRGTMYSDKTGSYIYDNSVDQTFSSSIKFLNRSIQKVQTSQPDFISNRLNGEDIVILFGAEEPTETE